MIVDERLRVLYLAAHLLAANMTAQNLLLSKISTTAD
jgi:hypothetical protein